MGFYRQWLEKEERGENVDANRVMIIDWHESCTVQTHRAVTPNVNVSEEKLRQGTDDMLKGQPVRVRKRSAPTYNRCQGHLTPDWRGN